MSNPELPAWSKGNQTIADLLKDILMDEEALDALTLYQEKSIETVIGLLDGIESDRLEEICAAERDGRLVVLPCKVGQVVYGLYCDPDDENAIIGFEVAKIEMQSTSPTEYWAVGDDEGWAADEMTFTDEHIGKTVFLTREAAEAAMQEGGQDE